MGSSIVRVKKEYLEDFILWNLAPLEALVIASQREREYGDPEGTVDVLLNEVRCKLEDMRTAIELDMGNKPALAQTRKNQSESNLISAIKGLTSKTKKSFINWIEVTKECGEREDMLALKILLDILEPEKAPETEASRKDSPGA